MNGETTADVGQLIERLRQGDDSARRALLKRVVHRLHRIAAATLRKEFPRLLPRHEIDSVVDEVWMRLLKALDTTRPESAEDFYRLMFHKVRQVLLDMARRQTRDDARAPQGLPGPEDAGDSSGGDRGDTTHDPARLAFWTEFHREVEGLPAHQRVVFDFHYFAELPRPRSRGSWTCTRSRSAGSGWPRPCGSPNVSTGSPS
jgi:DNA-directed RNA polymerase specialized sigma24 family protein